MTIEVYVGDYREKENPAALTLIFMHNDTTKALQLIQDAILPTIKYGMDVYIKNTEHGHLLYGYYRDLAKYPQRGQEIMINNGSTGLWYIK